MAVQLGHFVYENAGTGCLLSKYCNAGLQAPLTESASRQQPDPNFPDDPFCGQFLATWVEDAQGNITRNARLVITRKRVPNNTILQDLYTFEWQDLANPATRLYHGEAMRYKDLLIGAYR